MAFIIATMMKTSGRFAILRRHPHEGGSPPPFHVNASLLSSASSQRFRSNMAMARFFAGEATACEGGGFPAKRSSSRENAHAPHEMVLWLICAGVLASCVAYDDGPAYRTVEAIIAEAITVATIGHIATDTIDPAITTTAIVGTA